MSNGLLRLFGTLAGVAAALPGAPAAASVISNVATLDWTGPSGPASARSNQVDIAVATPPQSIEADFYTIDSTPNGTTTRLDGSGCIAMGGEVIRGPASVAGSPTVSISPSTSFTAGQTMAVAVRSPSDNHDPSKRETLTVTLTAANGDVETLELREDAVNSGMFVGTIQTERIPPAVAQHDCKLSVPANTPLPVALSREGSATTLISAQVSFLVDPFGVVFDSADGAPVLGSTVTIVNADTGLPAQVYGDDGVSIFPNSVVTGSTVTDSGGTQYAFPTGDYRFPFVAPGRYRLVVTPPDPYHWASGSTPADLAGLVHPDTKLPYTIIGASYGAVFTLNSPAPVRVDIPVDKPGAGITLTKTASVAVAVPGDAIQYRITVTNSDATRSTGRVTVTDTLPSSVRLRAGTMRLDGSLLTPTVAADGRSFTVDLPSLAANTAALLTYIGEVRPDAMPGDAINRVDAHDNRGTVAITADSTVRIRRDIIGERLTIIGRVTDGGCTVDPRHARGLQGVRIMLQDGSFAITDSDGQYHFEGVRPGLSVVAMDPSSLPEGRVALNCARNGRAAGSPYSRFVDGRGGDLKRADFHAVSIASEEAPADAITVTSQRQVAPPRPAVASDSTAAGANADLFAPTAQPIDWVLPVVDYNPRSPSLRIAIRYPRGHSARLSINGRAVDPLNFDGTSTSPDNSITVASWRAVPLVDGDNRLAADVLDASGNVVQHLTRTVHYSLGALHATIVRERSLFVADGITRPVVAVRLTDRDGRPVRQGVVGEFVVAPPHRAAIQRDAEQARQLAGLDRAATNWRVEGDDGVAYIELEPTTASGTARIDFNFRDDQVERAQSLDFWLNPGNRPWTVVGFAAGTLGYNTLADRMDPVAQTLPGDNLDGRIALYASGRVTGQWQATMAYDSDKEKDETRFGGVVDPTAYYTIYADRSDHGFDAASVRNLYLRLERPHFYALLGDFQTGINDPQLTRYQRSMNGLRSEYRDQRFAATAFVADTPYRYRRDEMQGNGLSGPYQLGARDILANSETVTIEVRDRLRSNIIVDRRTLSRHIDYDIDYFAGTLRFREPILSRDDNLNPQFIVVDYEVNGVGRRVTNAGGRVALTLGDDKLRIGATLIHDETDSSRTNMGGVDVRYRPAPGTEVRAEFAASHATATNATTNATPGTPHAWLVEVEHHGPTFDILAYARERDSGYGVGQLTGAGEGSRRFGMDGTLRLSHDLSLIASGWQEDYQTRNARRRAARLLGEWRTDSHSLRAGLTYANDDLGDGTVNRSTIVQLGGSQRLFNQKLELDAQTEFALGGNDGSVDFPARHHFGARYTLNSSVAIVGAYEIAEGSTVRARTARVGFDVRPWNGGHINLTGNRQDVGEFGPRSYAAYGLSQSFSLGDHWSVDATLDAQKTLSGIHARDVLDPAHPVASGGFLGTASLLTEDFTAVTAGATYRADAWSLTGRAEYRAGETVDRYGLTLGGIRTISEGRAFGGLLTWTRANATSGTRTQAIAAEVSWANRPLDSRWSWLEKVEFRLDEVQGAVAGQPGPIGGPGLLVSGDARSLRLINSLAINYTPVGQRNSHWTERGEYSLFVGLRYASDRYGVDDVAGFSTVLGADWRIDVSESVALGVAGNLRVGTDARALAYGGGPQVIIAPADNANFIIGYNVAGYRDRDFEEARYSRSGVYATFRLKFDQLSLQSLGLR